MNSRELLLAFWNRESVARIPAMPITMMFAADRIGRTYRDYVTDHRVLVQAQIQIARDFEIDYVSVISDPAREVADLGAQIEWFDHQPPSVNDRNALLADKCKLRELRIPDFSRGRTHDRIQAVRLLQEQVGAEKIVEGWIEGPCAESADLRGINTLMTDFYDDPDFVREMIDFVVRMEIAFGRAQAEAGADLIGIGDAASSLIGPKFYQEFIFPAQQRMVDALHDAGVRVRLHICGKTRKLYPWLGQYGCEIVDLDYMNPMDEARRVMGEDQVLLGNVAPVQVVKDGTPEAVYAAVQECHRQSGERYIAGAGCEIPRGTPPENLRALIRYAHEHTPRQFTASV